MSRSRGGKGVRGPPGPRCCPGRRGARAPAGLRSAQPKRWFPDPGVAAAVLGLEVCSCLLPGSLHSRRTEQLVANLCWALVTAAGDPHRASHSSSFLAGFNLSVLFKTIP